MVRLRKKINKIVCILICICLNCWVFSFYAEAADDINPFRVTSTELDKNGYFTVNINIGKNCTIEAYKLVVNYDSTLLSVSTESNDYGYYSSFVDKYNKNYKGMCKSNHLKEESKLIYAGAQPESEQAVVTLGNRFAYVTFCVNNYTAETKLEDILSKISVVVENCFDGKEDIVKSNSEIFALPVVIQIGDDLRGKEFAAGDIDTNGIVNLTDTMLALKAAIGIIELDEQETKLGDVDNDGAVTLNDTMIILKMALGIAG